jgi:hypothetical protein
MLRWYVIFHPILKQPLLQPYVSQFAENGEAFNVLHYGVGQMYVPHPDYFMDKFNTIHGGQRIATMLMYL